MLKKLKALLSLRAWLKSRTLNAAGILGAVAGADLATGSGIIQWVINAVMALGLSQPTAIAALVAVKAVAEALLRAKTDKGLADK